MGNQCGNLRVMPCSLPGPHEGQRPRGSEVGWPYAQSSAWKRWSLRQHLWTEETGLLAQAWGSPLGGAGTRLWET